MRPLAVLTLWLTLFGLAAGGYLLLVRPYTDRLRVTEQLRSEHRELSNSIYHARDGWPMSTPDFVPGTVADMQAQVQLLRDVLAGTAVLPTHTRIPVRLGLDSYSGYAVLRTPATAQTLATAGFNLELVDDQSRYAERYEALVNGTLQAAVFPLDSWLLLAAQSAKGGSARVAGAAMPPPPIAMLISRSQGADGIVAWADAVPSLDALNHPDARFVAVPDSPSQTLARITLTQFDLVQLPLNGFIDATGGDDVLKRLVAARGSASRHGFVLWEPELSRALAIPGVHLLVDSSAFGGLITDVLVLSRAWMAAQPKAPEHLVRALLRAQHAATTSPGGLTAVVRADAQAANTPLTDPQLARLAAGIHWASTGENYAALGLLPRAQTAAEPLKPTLARLARALSLAVPELQSQLQAVAAQSDIFAEAPLRRLLEANFHPGGAEAARAAIDQDLRPPPPPRPLTDRQWAALQPLGTLRVGRLVFARGTATLIDASRPPLAELAETMRALPGFYLLVRGHARPEGDPTANRALAQQRAEAAVAELRALGIQPTRLRAVVGDLAVAPGGAAGEAQSVTFVLGRPPAADPPAAGNPP
ncbi:MAG: phosphate ABC transporter substrate-binding/OmpA family protein [Planctomycetaceae bacterium]|jgi:outer membrane protein OmpA-like peptidoglycan-associated protein|nr:phosphate ABC transporter substrate-binding/OmpA family protein [Planctomycetaceae bacterium]